MYREKVLTKKCGCLGVFKWKITFATAKGYIPILSVDDTKMNVTKQFASITITRDTFSTILSGSFKLSVPQMIHKGHNGEIIQGQRTSDPIPAMQRQSKWQLYCRRLYGLLMQLM